MNKQRLQKLAGINELKVKNPEFSSFIPNKTWVIKSNDYKRFYQLVDLCDEWGIDVNLNDSFDFKNNYDFFYAIYFSHTENLERDQCIITKSDIINIFDYYSLIDDYERAIETNNKEEIKQNISLLKHFLNKLEEHSK